MRQHLAGVETGREGSLPEAHRRMRKVEGSALAPRWPILSAWSGSARRRRQCAETAEDTWRKDTDDTIAARRSANLRCAIAAKLKPQHAEIASNLSPKLSNPPPQKDQNTPWSATSIGNICSVEAASSWSILGRIGRVPGRIRPKSPQQLVVGPHHSKSNRNLFRPELGRVWPKLTRCIGCLGKDHAFDQTSGDCHQIWPGAGT